MERHGDDLSALGQRPVRAVLSHNIHKAVPLDPFQSQYPQRFPQRIEHLVASFKEVSTESLLAVAGATAGFYLLASAFAIQGAMKILILQPTYSGYEEAFAAYGHSIQFMELGADYSAASVDIPGDVDLVILGNPNNPTGTYQELSQWIKRYPSVSFVVDESFIQFTDQQFSLRNSVEFFPNLLVVESLTKFYGMAGIRLGLIYGSPSLIRHLRRFQVPWSVTVSEAFLSERFLLTQVLYKAYETEKQYVYSALRANDIDFLAGAANYYLLKVSNEALVFDFLIERGIITRRMTHFKGLKLDLQCLRIAIGNRRENEALLDALVQLKAMKGVL